MNRSIQRPPPPSEVRRIQAKQNRPPPPPDEEIDHGNHDRNFASANASDGISQDIAQSRFARRETGNLGTYTIPLDGNEAQHLDSSVPVNDLSKRINKPSQIKLCEL